MAGLIYYDTNSYTREDLYSVLKAIPNFWDETDDETSALVKGDITLNLGETKKISGYGITETISLGMSVYLIAATEKGVIVYTSGTSMKGFAVGCDKNDKWAGAYVNIGTSSTSPSIDKIIAEGVSSTSYPSEGNKTFSSTINTQIIDLSAANGDFTFDDLKRVLFIPVPLYRGKLTMSNGEKYVKCGPFALRYTE